MSTTENQLILNQEKKRFELEVEGKIAFIEYILNNENIMFLTHTEVPIGLEGKGAGSAIVLKTLTYIKEKKIHPSPALSVCSSLCETSSRMENYSGKRV
jgi:uncharacterized protein